MDKCPNRHFEKSIRKTMDTDEYKSFHIHIERERDREKDRERGWERKGLPYTG